MPVHSQLEGTFLEIGVGANDFLPMPTPLVGLGGKLTPFDFTGPNRYIGIDMPTEPRRSWRSIHDFMMTGSDVDIDVQARAEPSEIAKGFEAIKQQIKSFRPHDNIDFVIADAEALPFEDGSIAEVYMANVLGSQMRDENIQKILGEARRVVRTLGRLTIRENITPHWVPDNIEDMIDEAGFIKGVAKYMFGSSEYELLVEQYGLHPNDMDSGIFSSDHMFMVAEA